MDPLEHFHIPAEQQARRLFSERHPFWPMSLFDAIDDRPPSQRLRFAVKLFLETIPRTGRSDAEKKQRAWLTEISSLLAGNTSPEYCDMMAETVWYNDDGPNLVERGISRLYTALRCLLTANMDEYRRQVISSVTMLAEKPDPHADWDRTTLERAIDVFFRMQGKEANS